jgi:hypothetical protein
MEDLRPEEQDWPKGEHRRRQWASPFLEFDPMSKIHQRHDQPGCHSGQNARQC